MTAPKVDRLLTVGQVAKRLGTTERFPRRLIAQRRIKYIKLGAGRSGHVRIAESELERYIADCTIDATE